MQKSKKKLQLRKILHRCKMSVQPIAIECDQPEVIPEVIKSLKKQGQDLLDNDHYPIADGDSKSLLCGNRLLAYALIKRGIAKKLNKRVLFPQYRLN